MRVPPGLNEATFRQALDEFSRVVGREWVFTEDADLDLYRDAYSPVWGEPEERIASAALAPNDVEQVRAIMRIANKHKVPIYPISTGRNLGYGGSAPNYSGSVVLDLKRMNRIIEVNERNHYVLVEPGVSYFDLYKHIQERGMKLWLDVPDPGWGGLVGNALDHGGGYLQPMYRNHFDSHCGMEVVLADGDILRTGMGAVPGSRTWQEYKFGVGPWIDGLFSQSNYGVVTKMGFWVMPEPDAVFSGTVYVPRYEDLVALVDTLNYLENSGVTNGMPFLGSPVYGGFLSPPGPVMSQFLERAGPDVTDEAIREFARANSIPFWSVSLKFYGAEKALRENWAYCKAKYAEAIPGATFADGDMWKMPLKPEDIAKIHKPEFGIPSLEMFKLGSRSDSKPEPDWGHLWFSPIIPRSGEAILEANRVISEAAERLGLTEHGNKIRFSMPSNYWNRSFIFLFGFPVTRDPDKDRKMLEGFREIIRICAERGWAEYRTAPALQEDVVNTYSFNNHALRRFNARLKDAVDPNGILSAGRYGIWPKHLRKDV